jgi:transposase
MMPMTRSVSQKATIGIVRYPIVASLDVHDDSIYDYTIDTQTGEVLADCNILGGYKQVLAMLEKTAAKEKTMVLYEAGSHGFAPYRFFTRHGYACKLIAPTSIPHRAVRRKTDPDDAAENFHYHVSGLLRYVSVPTDVDEDAREALRYRFQLGWNITKEKQRIQALLKRYGLKYELGKTSWTDTFYKWLKSIETSVMCRTVLNMRLEAISTLESEMKKLDKSLDDLFVGMQSHRDLLEIFKYVPGIARVGAMVLVLEGGDLRRFPHPYAFMSYVGLFPGKRSSGGKDPSMRITKAGNSYLRYIIVGAAKFYADRRTLLSAHQIEKLPEGVRLVIKRCQDRLNSRYKDLTRKGMNSKKAKVAIARELCGFLWELAVKNRECTIAESTGTTADIKTAA